MIKLLADSTCDLSDEILAKYNISIAPLNITIGDETYRDRVDIFPEEFYSYLGSLEQLPTTAMPSPAEFLDIIDKAIEEGYTQFLCINMSSGTSGSYQSAKIAEEDFNEKYGETDYQMHVVDSKSMSQGSGYLILKCALLIEKGATYDELITFCETYKTNVKHFLSVDDLDNLIKSGRLSSTSAMIGKVLKVKPIMSMRDGRGVIVAKVRGAKKVLNHYVEEFNKRWDPELNDFIILGYTSDRVKAETLMLRIEKETDFKGEIYIMQMGVSVGTHVGLGGLSMFFIEKGHRHDGLIYNEMSMLLKQKDEVLKLLKRLSDR